MKRVIYTSIRNSEASRKYHTSISGVTTPLRYKHTHLGTKREHKGWSRRLLVNPPRAKVEELIIFQVTYCCTMCALDVVRNDL